MTETSGNRVREIDGAALQAVVRQGGRVLVEFWAPWCTQCGPMAGVVERFSSELAADVAVVKVSVEEDGVADAYGVMGLPALGVFFDGKQEMLLSGFKGVPALREELRSLVA